MVKTQGQRIRELRDEAELSLRELGDAAGGLSASFLSDIELGRRHPSRKVLEKLADALGTTKEDLQEFDTRLPVLELRRLAEGDPEMGAAFRELLTREFDSSSIWRLAGRLPKKGQEKCRG